MPSKQIHQLPAANRLSPEDQLLVSTAEGALTRRASLSGLPYRAGGAGAVLRTVLDKLGEAVSVKDYGAIGDGTGDDGPAFQAALNEHHAVYVPRGRYRLLGEVQVPPRRALVGAGRDATVIDARGERAFTFHRNQGAYAVEPGGTPDWARSRLGQMTIRMATGGVRVYGHEFHADGLRFGGGQPSGWCLELEDANECSLREISAGPGGGVDDLMANGIRLYGTDANRGVNFGDSLLEEISIKLKGPGTTGVLVEHLGQPSNGKLFVMNNLLLSRVQVNSAGAPAGSTGIWLKRVMRSALVNVDVEFLETAFRVEGAAGGGNAGSCRHISFVSCYVLNCAVPWVDSNATLPGSVMRCWFSNCNGFSPIGPVGVSSTDASARAGEGDEVLPSALWLPEPASGGAGVQLRSVNAGQFILTGDFHDGASPARDSNVKNKTPQRALGVDVTSANATRLYRPRGYAAGQDARLVIGNGETFQPDPQAPAAPLHRVEIADPLWLTQWSSAPPGGYGGNTAGILLNAGTAAAVGSPATGQYVGPGLYQLLNDHPASGSFAALWAPVAPRPGFGVMQAGRSGASYTVDRGWFGKANGMANAADCVITVPSGLIRADEDLASTHKTCARFAVRRGAAGRVTFQPGAGVTLYADGSTQPASSVEIPRAGQTVEVLYVRTGASTAEVWVVGGFHRATGALDGRRQVTADTTLASADLGKVVSASVSGAGTITVTVPAAALPAELEAGFLFLSRESDGAVVLAAGAGATLRTGGRTRVAAQGDTVQLLLERAGAGAINVRAVGALAA
jgi:hypothetical protein